LHVPVTIEYVHWSLGGDGMHSFEFKFAIYPYYHHIKCFMIKKNKQKQK